MMNTTYQDVQLLDIAKGPLKEKVSKRRSADGDDGTRKGLGPQPKQAAKVQMRRISEKVSP